MFRRIVLLMAICTIVFITACINSTTKISVKKDGSGTITETLFVNESVKMMMQGMMSEFAEEGQTEEMGSLLDPDEYKEKAARLGPGVSFVSAENITSDTGAEGIRIVYTFDDIRSLNYHAQPDNPLGDQMAIGMGAESSDDEDDNPITFDFREGRTPKLIIQMPVKDEPDTFERHTEEDISDPEEAAGAMGMMRMFMQDFHLRVMIEFDGKIQNTNASFIERIDGRENVILLDIALGDIMNNEEYFEEWQSMSQIRDMSEAMDKMSKIPGLKIETQDRVEITFK